ncbi:aldo/keto reductase family protein [Kribbella orskensis]|uniref:Aldo/keto reductase family protein n=1 Tax=Kribbella orskensis TaxID=2512216 RepID=A0ABY2BA79_9ACTN|nr:MULTISPECIES: aldo/keto reductase [Kribbella]TCN32865.1 aldo/keto reductase family protein [Kribbella sp. VKM Ac-2500]TCO13261.1 aldo/keto reductase family protein [Kribbella orskensis]
MTLGGSFALGPWQVHRAGYGAMQLAGDGVFGPPGDRDEALRVLRATVAAGVDHIDTAQFYGRGTVNQLITECEARAIAFVPFCPLGLPGEQRHQLLNDPVLATLGERRGASPAQLALAWLIDLAPNILLIPGTRTRAHLAENLAAADLRLDDAAHAELTRHLPAARGA